MGCAKIIFHLIKAFFIDAGKKKNKKKKNTYKAKIIITVRSILAFSSKSKFLASSQVTKKHKGFN
jgi:hypothetical protein